MNPNRVLLHFLSPPLTMNSVFLSSSILLFLFLNLPLFATSSLYSSCSKNFTCGDGFNVGFPFWGGERPDYCGHPALNLNCASDGHPILMIGDVEYLVLRLNESSKTLRITRTDFLNGICSQEFPDSTLDSNLFDLVSTDSSYLFRSNCSFLGFFSCTNDESVYWGPGAPLAQGVYCERSVVVYFSLSNDGDITNRTKIEEDVWKGFEVNWKINDENCRNCNGICGYDSYKNESICHSPPPADGAPSSSTAEEEVKEKKKSRLPLILGVAAGGAAIFCIFLGCIFCVVQRRKKHRMLVKHVSLPHFNNGVSSPTTNLSQSIPSFPYSKSDLEFGTRSTNYGVQVFNYSELEEATKNFDTSSELGEGGFGTVYYGKLSDGREVAVKRLYENNLKRVEQFKNEIEILAQLHHPNLVKLYGSTSRRSQELLLVYEYVPNGTVADHLHGKQGNSKLLDWHHRLRIAIQTANALTYLHRCDVIHRDVKTNNILLDSNFQVKVADFGLSRLFPNNVTHVSTAPQGTPGYVDPEYYQVYQLTDKSDVFSFGVVMVELISSLQAVDTSRHRHDINLSTMALNKIQTGALQELVDPTLGFETDFCTRRMITSVSELAFQCLQPDKEMRPSMFEVLESLRGIKNEELGTTNAEVVDVRADDVRLLKNTPPPMSPESVATEKWVSSSTAASSF